MQTIGTNPHANGTPTRRFADPQPWIEVSGRGADEERGGGMVSTLPIDTAPAAIPSLPEGEVGEGIVRSRSEDDPSV
jgi:hypothetical protein